jgi:signal transduction histidine kinase
VAEPPKRPGLGILAKLLVAYVVPTLVLFAVFGFVTHAFTRRELEDEMGKRLAATAAQTAADQRGKYLRDLVPGEEAEEDGHHQRCRARLERARAIVGARRIYVFKADYSSVCDTDPGVPIGAKYFQAEVDRQEIARVFQDRAAVSSVAFRGKDGIFYRAGYAPVTADDDDPTIVAALGVDAPAAYFTRLVALRRQLIRWGALLAGVVILSSLVVATVLTRPIRRLAEASERIGRGDLTHAVEVRGSGEIGSLGRTLDEMREALRARDQRLQMMLAGIAHEVRNPLGGIELFAGILRDELAADSEKLAHVIRIERELGHLKAVVTDFLEYARRPPPELRATALAPLLDDLRELVLADAETARVSLRIEGGDGLSARADSGQLRRALLNLTRNAIQATPEGGTVQLRARRGDAGEVVVEVSDTGKGIPPAELDKIFTPFFTTKEKGTGLGLAFVKEIVAEHGGTIRVESAVGRGTTFTIALSDA